MKWVVAIINQTQTTTLATFFVLQQLNKQTNQTIMPDK